jgi:hypothetical protein
MRDAATQIIEQWRRLGLQVRLAAPAADGTPPATWDILYATYAMIEPLVEVWKCVTLTGDTRVDVLTRLPVWLRHELLQLDQSEDWSAAQEQLHGLHRQLWAEVFLIPLWELNDVMIARKQVRGVPERPLCTYDGIERWTVEPWYPRDFALSPPLSPPESRK